MRAAPWTLADPQLSYLVLLQVGFALPPCVATGAVRSYRTLSPLPALARARRRFAFCCTFRGLAPPRRYLAPWLVEPGLSSVFREENSDCLADSARTVGDQVPPNKGWTYSFLIARAFW